MGIQVGIKQQTSHNCDRLTVFHPRISKLEISKLRLAPGTRTSVVAPTFDRRRFSPDTAEV